LQLTSQREKITSILSTLLYYYFYYYTINNNTSFSLSLFKVKEKRPAGVSRGQTHIQYKVLIGTRGDFFLRFFDLFGDRIKKFFLLFKK
jgi:hypothetical protein